MEGTSDKVSDFLEKHSVVGTDGSKKLNAINAILELWARIKTCQGQIEELQNAVGYYSQLEERVNKLEGIKSIDIVSPDQAKILLKGEI